MKIPRKKLNKLLIVIGAVATIVVMLLVLSGSGSAAVTISREDRIADSTQLQVGQQAYNQYCASCHGADGEGEQIVPSGRIPAPPHDSTGHTWHHSDQQLFQITKFGGSAGMPAFGDQLTDDEIEAVLAYIKLWWGPDELEYQQQLSQ